MKRMLKAFCPVLAGLMIAEYVDARKNVRGNLYAEEITVITKSESDN